MTEIRQVLARAARIVIPSRKEEAQLQRVTSKMMTRVEAEARRFEEVRDVRLGGSFAKGTWLPGDVDLDIFLRIEEQVEGGRFDEVGLAIGEAAVKGYPHGKKYAQHPYTEARVDGVKVNVVPCYDVQPGRWKSPADRSLYHVEFVNGNMDADGKLQVRLLKRFMKVVGVYGAEIENEGFSGYASEVLVYSQGGLDGVLRYFSAMRPEEAPFSLRDPVDPERELTKAISRETVARMMLASRAFLRSPDLAYFRVKRPRARKALVKHLYCIRFDHTPMSEDTLWGELKRSTRQLVKRIEAESFPVVRAVASSNDSDRSAIILLPELTQLPKLAERVGPGVGFAEEVGRFLAKNKDRAALTWVGDDGRLHVLQARRYVDIVRLLEDLCGAKLEEVGVSRDLADSIKKTGRILSGPSLVREGRQERWLGEGVDSIVSDSLGTDPA